MKVAAKLNRPASAQPISAFASVLLGVVLLTNSAQTAVSAELTEIKIGLLRSVQNGAVFIANEKGYFAIEGLAAKLTFFNTAQEIPVAVASHAADFAAAGTTASLYTLANVPDLGRGSPSLSPSARPAWSSGSAKAMRGCCNAS